ncbi:unnamed protein product [Rangifer tarandus platyrhynchus]|uniref:Uncharacterized protein n=2 Tax=Rangifer tarandus platyrhynchus TaxID=3082113 RepID=A0AC59ZE63_RANTA|nr:unnamed protein product [Rangifer tarandus platyrhynchus]
MCCSGLLFFETHHITNFQNYILILDVLCVCMRPLGFGHTIKLLTSLQNLSLKIGRENGPGVTEDSLFMLLTVITEKTTTTQVLSGCIGKHFMLAFKLEMYEQNETISSNQQ